VYDNFEHISGVSFLPYDGGGYQQAPYEEISREEYLRLKGEFPVIDYAELGAFESEDTTTGAQTYACTAAGCEIN
jgi:ribonucleoside-diphosphate reductase alpha chain